MLPQQWTSAVRPFLAVSCFSLILLTFRRRQRSPERLEPNIQTVNAALTSVPLLNEQHRTVEDLKAIVGGWRIKRAMKLKCFWSDDVGLQGHFSPPMLWISLSRDPNHLFAPAIYTLHAEFSVLWSERHSCWRGEFRQSDHHFSLGTCKSINAACTGEQ